MPNNARRTFLAGTLIVVSEGISDCFASRRAASKMSWVSIARGSNWDEIRPSASPPLADAGQRLFVSRSMPCGGKDSSLTSRPRKSPARGCLCGSRRRCVPTRTARTKSSSRRRTSPQCCARSKRASRESGIASSMRRARDGRTVYASAPMGSEPWGPGIYRGRAGAEPKATQAAPKFKEGSDLSVSRIWHIEPGPSKTPDTIYAGVEPAALFRSDNRGEMWHDLDTLNYHPTRKEWQPGGGGLCLHSVLVDPRNARHLIVGISAVGSFETRDGGRS